MPLQSNVSVTRPHKPYEKSHTNSPEANTLEVEYVGDLIDVPAGCKAAGRQRHAHDELIHLCMGAAAGLEVSRVCQACALENRAQAQQEGRAGI